MSFLGGLIAIAQISRISLFLVSLYSIIGLLKSTPSLMISEIVALSISEPLFCSAPLIRLLRGSFVSRDLGEEFGVICPPPQKGLFHDSVTTDNSANEDGPALNLLGFWAKEACVPRSTRSETLRFPCFISCLISGFSQCLGSFDTLETGTTRKRRETLPSLLCR